MSDLWSLAQNGKLTEIKHLVSTGKDVNYVNTGYHGMTPLLVALECQRTSVAEYLISLPKCDLQTRNSHGESALHAVCGHNPNYSTLKLLVEKGVDINTTSHKGKTGLHLAIEWGQTSIIEYLISLPECDLQVRRSDGWTPLQLACSNRSNIDIVRLLIKKGVNINTVNDKGSTALHLAIQNTYSPLAEYLISLPECDIHIKDYERKTALDIAGQKKNLIIANLLKERVSAKNSCKDANVESKEDTSKQEQQSNNEQTFTQCLQEELHQLGRNKDKGNEEVKQDGEMQKAPVEIEKPEIITEAQGATAAVGSTKSGLSDRKLLHIAKELGSDWKTLGGFLGIPHAVIQRIHQTYPGETLHCGWCMLIEWRDGHNEDTKSQEEDLKNALQDHGKLDVIKLLL